MSRKSLIIILICLIVVCAGLLIYKIFSNNSTETVQEIADVKNETSKKLQIIDEDAHAKSFAVMINNNHAAWPHAGLQDAYLCYEIIVEGGISRILAIFNNQETAKIGSVRSARHYFIDYALENDAIFVHYGGSPQAYSYISNSTVKDIDGISADSAFWRDKTLNKAYEHTAFTSMEKLKANAESRKLDLTSSSKLLLNYSVDEIDLSGYPDAIKADNIYIRYSDYHSTSYKYDAENKNYLRSMSDTEHVDAITGKQYTVKNIITYQVSNYTLNDGENKGRQELNNVGSGTGYYITNGYAVPITWEKSSHSAQTVYKYNGEELKVNDGNTYIQIQPKDQKLEITSDSTQM